MKNIVLSLICFGTHIITYTGGIHVGREEIRASLRVDKPKVGSCYVASYIGNLRVRKTLEFGFSYVLYPEAKGAFEYYTEYRTNRDLREIDCF